MPIKRFRREFSRPISYSGIELSRELILRPTPDSAFIRNAATLMCCKGRAVSASWRIKSCGETCDSAAVAWRVRCGGRCGKSETPESMPGMGFRETLRRCGKISGGECGQAMPALDSLRTASIQTASVGCVPHPAAQVFRLIISNAVATCR